MWKHEECMMGIKLKIFIISLFFTAVCWSQSWDDNISNNAIQVSRLRCEYLANPLGIDETEPRLGWIVTSEARGQRQTAYQISLSNPCCLPYRQASFGKSGPLGQRQGRQQ